MTPSSTPPGLLLRRQGYGGTGFNEIVARSGAPKGSLYFHFPGGKEELAAAAMQRTGEQLRAAFARRSSPRAMISGRRSRACSTRSPKVFERSDFRDGCPIATVTLEAAPATPTPLSARGRGDVRLVARRAAAAIARSPALREPRPSGARCSCFSAIEGALILARARRDLAPLLAVREELVELSG